MNATSTKYLVALAAAVLVAGCATSPPLPAAQSLGLSDPLLQIASYEFGQSHEPLHAVENLVREALHSPAETKALAAGLAALLESDATLECKRFVCRQLSLVGGEENVPALAALLKDKELGEMARYALQPIPGKAVDAALIQALGECRDSMKAGIVNTLGMRRSVGASDVLEALTSHRDPEIAGAARAALARIGT